MNAVIELTTAARVLAQLRARNAVKDAIRRQGHKPSALTAAEIKSWAELFVADHPSLREQAMADARKMILDGLLGRRAQRALGAKLTNSAQSKEPCSTSTISVRNLGAE